ncbi:MAG TPA: ATP-binding protein [Candidatus Saccharimonadales bacterium]|nr:ATP-binding protein [Candidatus Saccharimonadales bacterium]
MARTVEHKAAHNQVTVDSSGLIVATLRGFQNAASVHDLNQQLQTLIAAQRAQGKRALFLVDIRSLTNKDGDSSARLEGRKALDMPADATAIVGNSRVAGIILYILRGSNPARHTKFFTSEHKARQWLQSTLRPKRSPSSISLIASAMTGTIGLLTLIGWHIGNTYLTSWLPSLTPMNPMAAVGVLCIAYGFFCYWRAKWRQLKLVGALGVFIGVAALLSIHVGHFSLTTHIINAGTHIDLSDSGAICFMAAGLMTLTVGTKRASVRFVQYCLASLILGLSLCDIFGELYAHDFLYSISFTFAMAFNLAITFLITGSAFVLLVLYRSVGNVLGWVTRTGWLVLVAMVCVQAVAYSSWNQIISRNRKDAQNAFAIRTDTIRDALDQRIQAYTDALHGFQGLFAASEFVDQGEFQAYYNSLHLAANYPGLQTLSFITKVNDKDIPAFIAARRADKSLNPAGNPTFAIANKTTLPVHYVLTYNASANTVGGTDLGSTPNRLRAFQKADATSAPVSSGTLQFGGTNGQPVNPGFFITIPVHYKTSPAVIGYVNAVFYYNTFFAKAFAAENLTRGVNMHINDSQEATPLYTSNTVLTVERPYSSVIASAVADRSWQISVAARPDFGISLSQAHLPRTTLISGQLFSVLLIVIFILQNRARRQALELADSITIDLQNERNLAVANDQKSSAILASIGDAVFAVDNQERITLFNPAAEHISGYSQDEALGKPYKDILRFVLEKDHSVSTRFIKSAFEGRTTSMRRHTMLMRKDGSEVAVADSAAPIHDGKNHIQGVIIVFRDVSKEQALDKAKTEFVSLASHQLRTPLSAINWYNEMLLSGDAGRINKTQRDYLQEISDGNKRMVDLVNSLLNVSRLEVGKLRNEPQRTSMTELAASLGKEMAASVAEKQLSFTNNVPSKLPNVYADPKLLRMVLQNLLSNAIKYTPAKGTITLTMRSATANDIADGGLPKGHYLFASVADSGFGIPKAQQDKIFEKLFRADNVRTMHVEGTGLGLYIVKEVVTKLGGQIWFTSAESVGTTFSVLLPLKTRAS